MVVDNWVEVTGTEDVKSRPPEGGRSLWTWRAVALHAHYDPRTFLWLISAPSEAPDVWRIVKSEKGSHNVTLFWKVRCAASEKPELLPLCPSQ